MNESEIRKEYSRWVEATKANKDINSELVAIRIYAMTGRQTNGIPMT